jgi:hypothetical protein
VLELGRRAGSRRWPVQHGPGLDPGRHEQRRDADAEAVEGEGEGLGADDAVGAGHDAGPRGRGHVVVEAAVLVVGDDEERLGPLRARAQRLVHLLDEALALGHVVGRMVVVPREEAEVEVALLHDHVAGQPALPAVAREVEVEGVEAGGVLELAEAPVEERGRRVLVVDAEGEALVVERVEDGPLREARHQRPAVVADEAVGGGGVHEQPVGLRGRRVGREPAVAHGELPHQVPVHGHGVGAEAGHDGGGHAGPLLLGLLREAGHGGGDARRGGGRRGGVDEGRPVDLLVDGLHGVARVRVHVLGAVAEADGAGGRVGGVHVVGLGPRHAVDVRVQRLHPPQHVVEGAVLLHQHHHRLDLIVGPASCRRYWYWYWYRFRRRHCCWTDDDGSCLVSSFFVLVDRCEIYIDKCAS